MGEKYNLTQKLLGNFSVAIKKRLKNDDSNQTQYTELKTQLERRSKPSGLLGPLTVTALGLANLALLILTIKTQQPNIGFTPAGGELIVNGSYGFYSAITSILGIYLLCGSLAERAQQRTKQLPNLHNLLYRKQ